MEASSIRYIAIQGAGGKGAAYLGALISMENLKIFEKKEDGQFNKLKGISGTSAGSITALMLSLGFTASETNEMVIKNPLFIMTLDEKNDVSRYRAYKSFINSTEAPEIGFIVPGVQSFKEKGLQEIHNSINADKYTLSNKMLSGFDSKELPKTKLKQFLENTGLDVFKTLIFKAAFRGLMNGLQNPIVLNVILEEVADEIYDEFFGLFEQFREFRDRIQQGNDFLEGVFGFQIDLFDTLFESVDMALESLFESWNNDRVNGVKNIGIAYAGVCGLLLLSIFCLTKKYTDKVFEDDSELCDKYSSGKNSRRKKRKELLTSIQSYIRLVWHSIDIPNIPIITSLLQICNEEFTTEHKVKKVIDILETLRNTQNLSLLMNDITTVISEVAPKLIDPVKIMIEEGGILDGCRIRYIFARLIYEKVGVNSDEKGNFIGFYKRKRNLSNQILDNLDYIFESNTKESKPLKDMKAKQKSLEKKLDKLKKNQLSEDETVQLLASLDSYVKEIDQISAGKWKKEQEKHTDNIINKLEEDYENQHLISTIEKKLILTKELIDLYEMREHLKYIERYYSFEEHYKLFTHELVTCSSNITSGEGVYFNRHLTPDFSLVEACSISMNIPGLWRPSALDYCPSDGKGRQKDGNTDKSFYKEHYYGWFEDGGLNENIPLFAFNGYETNEKDAQFRTPEEMSLSAHLIDSKSQFPINKIVGVSNFAGFCKYKDGEGKYIGGSDAKKEKESALWLGSETFVRTKGGKNKKGILSIAGDIFNSLFGYGYKLRGFELEPFRSHILTVDYGFMGMLEFSVNTEELLRIEKNNYNLTNKFFNKKEESKPNIINFPLDRDYSKKGRDSFRKAFRDTRINDKRLTNNFLN